MKFEELNIAEDVKRVVKNLGFEELMPIQEQCTPLMLEKKDVVGQAETGSGKTIAFVLPIVNDIYSDEGIQVLVLTPTRELCIQVGSVFEDFGNPLGLKTLCIYGGVSIVPQIRDIETANIIVATPGRMLDHIGRKTIDFSDLKFFVLDEADKMFEMGFIEDVEDIISYTPKDIQAAMFSATFSDDVYWVMERHLNNPVVIKTKDSVDPSKLKQTCYDIMEQGDKFSVLLHLLNEENGKLAIVFCATRHESEYIARNLRSHKINAAAIHGGMTQHARINSLQRLKNEEIDVLVATDVAARGLDIKNVTHVYNYDVPGCTKEYLHRIGRTARAGEEGDAITLLTPRDHDNYRGIRKDFGEIIEMKDAPEVESVKMLPRGGDERSKGGRDGRRGGRRDSRSGSRHSSGGRSRSSSSNNSRSSSGNYSRRSSSSSDSGSSRSGTSRRSSDGDSKSSSSNYSKRSSSRDSKPPSDTRSGSSSSSYSKRSSSSDRPRSSERSNSRGDSGSSRGGSSRRSSSSDRPKSSSSSYSKRSSSSDRPRSSERSSSRSSSSDRPRSSERSSSSSSDRPRSSERSSSSSSDRPRSSERSSSRKSSSSDRPRSSERSSSKRSSSSDRPRSSARSSSKRSSSSDRPRSSARSSSKRSSSSDRPRSSERSSSKRSSSSDRPKSTSGKDSKRSAPKKSSDKNKTGRL